MGVSFLLCTHGAEMPSTSSERLHGEFLKVSLRAVSLTHSVPHGATRRSGEVRVCRACLFFVLRTKLSGVAHVFVVRTQPSFATVFALIRREKSVMESGSVVIYSHFVFGQRCSHHENLFVR